MERDGILLCNCEITQEPLVEGTGGEALNIYCKHPSASKGDAIHWYRQFPNQTLHFIVYGYSGKEKSNKLKEAFLFISEDQKSSILSFTRVTLEDSAVYYCAVSGTVLHSSISAVQELFPLVLTEGILPCKAEKITQEPLMVGSDGKELTLSCNHPSASSSDYIYWYQQFPSQGLEFVASGYNGKVSSNKLEGVFLFISQDRKSSTLSFTRVTLEDSAVYYCALSDTVLSSRVSAVQELCMKEGLMENPCPNQNPLLSSKRENLFCCHASMKPLTLLQHFCEGCAGESVDQTEDTMTVTQGDNISIKCHYELSSDYRASPFWYIQPLREHPKLLLSHLGNVNLSEYEGFEAEHDKKHRNFNLEKPASQLNDSAVYFCAVS
ncbi:hypothetical protein JD844_001084 [Phrynosoma platyrhinos]|uniref:Ig-like domain-containing protein n=1 Tax=Phrynosoma platyrhinos TaxID=52577 RepID=A0ABQ7T9P4_PHRPL|nr:hypothetical protein JD844_001084 [Phrynosoma platyrhinos]